MRVKIILSFLLIINFHLIVGGERLKVIDRIKLKVSPLEGHAASQPFEQPYFFIYEGVNGELLINRGAYLEIFSKEGNYLKRIGGLGDGPGEFAMACDGRIFYSGYYYFFDFPYSLNIFSKDWKFVRRIFWHQIIGKDFFIINDQIFVLNSKSRVTDKSKLIYKYDLNGKLLGSILDGGYFFKYYPHGELLFNHIHLASGQSFYLGLSSINRLFLIDFSGRILKEYEYGRGKFKCPVFDQKRYEKAVKQKNGFSYIMEVFNSGDHLWDIGDFRDFLIVVTKRVVGDFDGMEFKIYLVDRELKGERGPFQLNGYLYVGHSRERIYFIRYLEDYNRQGKTLIEVLRCVIEN